MGTRGLWADMLLQKYMLRDDNSLFSYRRGDSRVWKFICEQKEIADLGAKWQVRSGHQVNFFQDKWLLEGSALINFCRRPLTLEESSSSISDWVDHGTWDLSKLAEIV